LDIDDPIAAREGVKIIDFIRSALKERAEATK